MTEYTEHTDEIDLAEIHMVDAVLDVLSTGIDDEQFNTDTLLALLIAWRIDVDTDPMDFTSTAA